VYPLTAYPPELSSAPSLLQFFMTADNEPTPKGRSLSRRWGLGVESTCVA
jgi:hypothetical protein